jgi:hypothetical protein
MYPVLFDVSLQIKNGLLYDWKTNSWVEEINENVLVSETEKNYHFKCADRYKVEIDIYGKRAMNNESIHVDNVDDVPCLIHGDTGVEIHHTYDLSKYVFRQAVLDKLFIAKSNDDLEMEHIVKKDIADLFSKLRKYMTETNKMDDSMLKQLCDDLSIAYKTLGTENGRLLSSARQSGQGRQKSRNVSSPMHREITPLYNNPDREDDFTQWHNRNEIDAYIPSENPISCYATPQATQTMRSMSQPYCN